LSDALPSASETLREILFDTESTGFDPKNGDRLVEIAAIEIRGLMPTGRVWHEYINPDRDVPLEAFKVHGLDRNFLRDKKRFPQVVDSFLEFIGDAQLVAHNASFDMNFVNAELVRMKRAPLKNRSVDTVALAKQAFPGAKVTLDHLCRRFGIDLSARTKHNALLDTQLLGRVYLELRGGRHRSLSLDAAQSLQPRIMRPYRAPRDLGSPSPAESARHAEFVSAMKSPIWHASIAAQPYALIGRPPGP
jgi:DNA polymerase-3 subunit epsilon